MWLPMVVVIAAFGMLAYLYPLIRMDYASQREVQRLETQLDSLRDRNDDLREEVDRLKTPAGVEQAARESLGYVKPGENAYVVVEEEGAEETVAVMPVAETVLAEEPPPWWQRLLDRVFGVDS